MATTTNLALRYPSDGDDADGPLGLANLANDVDALFGPWSSYTPAVAQNGALTMTTNYAKRRTFGHWMEFNFKLTYASGTGTGGTKITVALPANAAANGYIPVGPGALFDSSASTYYKGMWVVDSGVADKLVLVLAGGLAGAATMTAAVTTGDVLYCSGALETV